MEFPATIDLRTYPVRLNEGHVEVWVAADIGAHSGEASLVSP